MSDLALPFLLLTDDDALAFWCFERLMRKVRATQALALDVQRHCPRRWTYLQPGL